MLQNLRITKKSTTFAIANLKDLVAGCSAVR